MIRCPDCGEEKRIHEKPGLYMSLYTCEACGCEFRQCESDQVAGLYKQIDRMQDEIDETSKEIEHVKKVHDMELGILEENISKLLRKCYTISCKIDKIRQERRDKVEQNK